MRILHINKFFDLHGGAETVLHSVMERQERAGHEVHILSTSSPGNLPSRDSTRFVERFDYSMREGWKKDLRKGVSFLWNAKARRAITRILAEIHPEVVHLHNIYHHLSTSILAPIRRAHVPCVHTLHDYKLACPNYLMFTEGSICERCKGGRYFQAIRHRCLSTHTAGNALAAVEMSLSRLRRAYERTVGVFICPSQFMADKMTEWGEPADKLAVIRNAVELPVEAATRDGGYVFVAARLSEEKGFGTLIRAAAQVPEVRVKIAGRGPEDARLRSLAKSLNASNVEFLGFLNRSSDRDVWRRAAALAAPSVWFENAPLSVLEGMAAGLPIIASRIGGLPELVVHGENGYLVEPGSVEAWAAALRTFGQLKEPERARMATCSRARAEESFSWQLHLDALFAVYVRAGAKD